HTRRAPARPARETPGGGTRALSAGFDEADGLRRRHEHHAPALGGRGMFAVGWRVEIIPGLELIAAHSQIALDDEEPFAPRMIVPRHACAGVHAQEKRRGAARLVVAQRLDRNADRRHGPPARLRASHDAHLSLRAEESTRFAAR